MAVGSRRWVTVSLCVIFFGLLTACSPLTVPFFLFSPEPKIEATLKRVASEDKDESVKVVVLTYRSQMETRPELVPADRELTRLFVTHLRELCKENKEHVSIVAPNEVDRFKADHPDWRKWDLSEIGNRFG